MPCHLAVNRRSEERQVDGEDITDKVILSAVLEDFLWYWQNVNHERCTASMACAVYILKNSMETLNH